MTAHSCEVLQPIGVCYRCDLNREESAIVVKGNLVSHDRELTAEEERHAIKFAMMENALRVIILTPHIVNYLTENDPKALEQAEQAVTMKG